MSLTQTVSGTAITRLSDGRNDFLSQSRHKKTLDIGNKGNTVSTNHMGDLLQLSCFHPLHGIVVACPFAQFDGDRFHDSEYVRKYRTKLLDYFSEDNRGYGIHFKEPASNIQIQCKNGKEIQITYSIGTLELETTVCVNDEGDVVQSINLRSASSGVVSVDYALVLDLSVNRASYGQLTEGGPLPLPRPQNEIEISKDGKTWALRNSSLNSMVEGALYCDHQRMDLSRGMETSERASLADPVNSSFRGRISLRPNQTRNITAVFRLRPGIEGSEFPDIHDGISHQREYGWRIDDDIMRRIIIGNLSYIINNCAIPIDGENICFIADHVALPLGWNRDNYWQIRYLLDIHNSADQLLSTSEAQECRENIQHVVRKHLNWVFTRAQRPHGYWHRSYLTTGVPKDGPVFQQDQQCYPILELCDFFKNFPSEREFVMKILNQDTIATILSVLAKNRDVQTGLYMTEETPGDDAVDYPFHFSSHILLWHTYNRLADLVSELNFESPSLNSLHLRNQASTIRKAILEYFVAVNPATGTSMYAYLTDGAGIHTFYHDANDLPTLFIPTWKFALPSTPEHDNWTRTMEFGLSSANKEGFFPERPYGGLGSVHTSGPWPLGYAQELVYAKMTSNSDAARDAWRRIQGSMFWDGLFSEAVNAETGGCTSKAWFSWPGSMIGSALLKYGVPRIEG